MDVKDAIQKRRAYRSLDPVDITEDLIVDLARCAQLSASCSNNQSWRYLYCETSSGSVFIQAGYRQKNSLQTGNGRCSESSWKRLVITKLPRDFKACTYLFYIHRHRGDWYSAVYCSSAWT